MNTIAPPANSKKRLPQSYIDSVTQKVAPLQIAQDLDDVMAYMVNVLQYDDSVSCHRLSQLYNSVRIVRNLIYEHHLITTEQ